MKTLSLALLFILGSCGSILHKDQGSYGAFIFEEADFSPGQPPLLIKDHSVKLYSEGCGIQSLNLDSHYKTLKDKYRTMRSEHMVGMAEVKIQTYVKLLLITALPCMKVEAKPFIVKSWQKGTGLKVKSP